MTCDPTTRGVRPCYSTERLPPYTYIPGRATPHPVSDPRGHMYGAVHQPPAPLVPESWQSSSAYLFAADLFNHGFYWEAHEAWESLWHAAGRQGLVAAWLKGLIKIAAACVKGFEGNAVGVERHARRALELLADVRRELPAGQSAFAGMSLPHVEGVANSLLKDAPARFASPLPACLLREWLPLGET
jgi:uncharacterized protein